MALFSSQDFVTDAQGNAVPTAQVYYLINQSGATASTIDLTQIVPVYSDTSAAISVANPVLTDGTGRANTGYPNTDPYLNSGVYSKAFVVGGVVQQVFNDFLFGAQGATTITSVNFILNSTFNNGSPFTFTSGQNFNSGFRITAMQSTNTAASVSSTMPSLSIRWTDVSQITRTVQLLPTNSSNSTSSFNTGTMLIQTNGGNIAIVSSGYASSGSPALVYTMIVTAEQLF